MLKQTKNVMKNLILFIGLTLVVTGNFNSNAQTISITAGATLTGAEGIDSGIGFYTGILSEGRINDYFAFSAGVDFMKQTVKINKFNLRANSVNAAFYYKVYPAKEKFSLIAGFQVGFITSMKFDGENVRDYDVGQLYIVTGLGYEINDKIEITARYLPGIGDNLFDYTVRGGLNYRLK